MKMKMKVVERITTVEKKYGGITEKTLKSTNDSIAETDEQYTVDYDLVTVYYDQLITAEKSKLRILLGDSIRYQKLILEKGVY
jgi:hypothetical protein